MQDPDSPAPLSPVPLNSFEGAPRFAHGAIALTPVWRRLCENSAGMSSIVMADHRCAPLR